MIRPPVTDDLPIAIRAYAEPTYRVLKDPKIPPDKLRRKRIPSASPWTLAFDTETTTDVSQALRFGTYQLRNAGDLVEAGIFYAADGVTAGELALLRRYAESNGLILRTRDEFADKIFFRRAYQLRATVIGFNLPFDISRLAISHNSARTPSNGEAAAMHGGFTFKLSSQKIYPNIRVKHMSRTAALIAFAAPMGQPDGRGQRNRGIKTRVRRGHFIDVKTLSKALFAKGFTLASLSHFLRVPNPKLEFDDFDGPISEAMVDYAVRDVQTTWECYAELNKRFTALNLRETSPEKIYSEAGIGKGYIREMGIGPLRKMQPEMPSALLAKIMASYFGGRSEVRVRREIRQVMLCDFLSMYPTVCTLMGLWRFVIAKGMEWRDSTEATRDYLAQIDLAGLQSRDSWRQLATLVRVRPDADIFPVRASYLGEAQTTIGSNYLSSDRPLWFTLADCIASKLLTGKTPEIVEALSFAPGPMQSGLRPIDVAGNPQYRVDPVTTDFFKRVIELRQSIKSSMTGASEAEKARLDTEQNALKICANSTSYGIWVEVNVETRPSRKSVTVHNSTSERFTFPTDKTEMPGTYFHPLLATLITGAARLMLAIAERLATDAGLDWAFCDTDSMAFAKPVAMAEGEFSERCHGIVNWFAGLNPYDFGGSILKIEEVNFALQSKAAEPLYCLAISSKRYALFNLAADGSPIMRKVSAHGLGHLSAPYGEADALADFPVPDRTVLREGTLRWHCDLWHRIATATLAAHPDRVARDYHPALNDPAISRYAATSPNLLRWFKSFNAERPYRSQVKPFGFLHSLSPAICLEAKVSFAPAAKGRRKKAKAIKPIAPYDSDHRKSVAMAFDRETGNAVSAASLSTYADALARYHISPESKFLNGDYCDSGMTQRRHIRVTGVRHIGKESNDWERQAILGYDAEAAPDYGLADKDRARLISNLAALVRSMGRSGAARALGISEGRLRTLSSGGVDVNCAEAQTLAARVTFAMRQNKELREGREADLQRLREGVQLSGLREIARQLGIDPSNLRRRLRANERHSGANRQAWLAEVCPDKNGGLQTCR